MKKSTTSTTPSRIELFQTLMKSEGGEYIACLSDNSIDRDDEIVGIEALQKLRDDNEYLVGLTDHENKVSNIAAEWTNRRIMEVDGHMALVSNPKFYQSTASGREVKGLLDEGAKLGVSIGAMVKNYETREIEGKKRIVYTELELVEASFVAVPSNRHGMAMALAKSFSKKISEETMAEKQYTEKEYSQLLEEKTALEKQLQESQEKVTSLEKKAEEVSEESKAQDKAEKEANAELVKQVQAMSDAQKELRQELEKLKKTPVNKAINDTPEGDNDAAEKADDIIKAQKGGLPVFRK